MKIKKTTTTIINIAEFNNKIVSPPLFTRNVKMISLQQNEIKL